MRQQFQYQADRKQRGGEASRVLPEFKSVLIAQGQNLGRSPYRSSSTQDFQHELGEKYLPQVTHSSLVVVVGHGGGTCQGERARGGGNWQKPVGRREVG